MDSLKEQYDDAIRERADAFMKAVTIAIIKENADEYEALEKETEKFRASDSYQEKKWSLIARLEKAENKRTWQMRMKKFGKVAAVILLCLVTVCTVLTATVDAFRFKVFDFLMLNHGEYLELVPVESIESEYINEEDQELFPDDCEGSFYPTSLPEGFELSEVFEGGSAKYLTFVNEDDEFVNLSISPAGETKTGIDNENVTVSEVDINGIMGYTWEKDGTCLMIWISYEHQFKLFSETLSFTEMLEMAESVKYLKIK